MERCEILWLGGMEFEATTGSGHSLKLDASVSAGGGDTAVRPFELLAVALGACTAMDVISILRKKRQDVTGYRVEVQYEQREGEWPHPMTAAIIKHIITGHSVEQAAVTRAIELSNEKYCSVHATMNECVRLSTEWEVLEA